MEQHLTDGQIDALLETNWEVIEGPAAHSKEEESAKVHLQNCRNCWKRFCEQGLAMDRLPRLNPDVPAAPGPDCPPVETWTEMVAGIKSHEADAYLSHAIRCDHCGPLLREAADDLADDLSPTEEDRIDSLRSSSPEGQRKLATLVRSGCDAGAKRELSILRAGFQMIPSPIRIAFAASVLGISVVSIWLVVRMQREHAAAALIAAAYSEKRTVEVRIEGAPYAPLQQERGAPDANRMARPALLKAEAEIARHLNAKNEDVKWLQASGRAGLMEDTSAAVEQALSVLLKAQELDPNNKSVMVDAASAYLLRGQLEQRKEDVGKAVDLLGRVVSQNPQDEVAQFNYALALESLDLNDRSIAAWETFLSSYPNSPWRSEAHQHLERLQRKVGSYNLRRSEPPLSVNEVAAAFASGRQQEIDKIDALVEEYQKSAIRTWLPSYFSPQSSQRTAERAALVGLANLLHDRHGDDWLLDLLRSRNTSAMERAVESLARSEILIEGSDDTGAQATALAAMHLFHQAGSPAGSMRSRLDLVYILQMQHQTRACEATADKLARELSRTSYHWIQVQNNLERAACASTCDMHELQLAESARTASIQYRFPDLESRAANFVAGSYQVMGDRHHAWNTTAESLQQFWNGHYDPKRGFNLLTNLDNLAEDQEEWFLERAVLEEEWPLTADDPNVAIRAMAIERLGEAQLAGGDVPNAQHSFRTAEQVFTKVPAGVRRDALNAEIQVDLAKAELQSNLPASAVMRLQRIRSAVSQIPDDDLQLKFFQTSGIAELRTGQVDYARRDLNAAIRLAENGLSLVKTEADRWRWRSRNEAEYRALVELDLRSDVQQALRDWEFFKGATLHVGYPAGSGSPDVKLLRSADEKSGAPAIGIGSDALFVSYFVAPDVTTAWVWDLTRSRAIQMPLPEAQLSLLVRRFSERCSDPSSSMELIRQEAATLYDELIRPLEGSLADHRELVVEPDGILRKLPFEALIDAHGEYLGNRFAVVISPGVEYLNRSMNWVGITRASDALIIGNPAAPGWAPLPEAEQEAKAIAALFQSPRVLLHHADLNGDLGSAIARVRVFHFSGHATATAESSGLAVSDSSTPLPLNMNVSEALQTRLVVLSACSSALGTTGQFDDEDSLVRRLLAARVPAVIASRWAVDSAATAVLMKAFYEYLLDGRTASVSLALARREIRSQSPFSHPYYWAGFSDFGRS